MQGCKLLHPHNLLTWLQMIKMLFQYFQDNIQAKTRVYKIYCANVSSGVSFQFGLLRTFFSDMLYSRIHLTNGNELKLLLEHCNPGQLEKKWGGNAQNLKEGFWQPKVPNTNFFNRYDFNRLESPEQFKEKFLKGETGTINTNDSLFKVFEKTDLE